MIEIRDLFFTYPGEIEPVLRGVNVQISDGEICLVAGPSGAGKSTLLRCINGLVPHFSGGTVRGTVRVNGLDPVRLSPREMSRTVGFVFQDPESQFVVDIVEDEIAFSLENAALPAAEMETRVDDMLQLLDLSPLRSRHLDTLSGGERQRVAIAAAMVVKPEILVLDEPTSQLDPGGADEVLKALVQLNAELGLTVILAEHRLERVLPFTRNMVYLSGDFPHGLAGKPQDVLTKVPLTPPVITLGKIFGWKPLPLSVSEARSQAQQMMITIPGNKVSPAASNNKNGKPVFIQADGIRVNFGDKEVLRHLSLSLHSGEITVMLGPNGAGKTTFLRSLVGLLPVQEGTISVAGMDIKGRSVADICQQVGYLPQDPNALLFADTVLEELLITLRNHQIDPASAVTNPGKLLERLGLAEKARQYPRDLSTGERQRVAMGAVMVTHPGALLLDEPTRGLDYEAKNTLGDLLGGWRNEGMAILVVTHDVELAAQIADRAVILENGSITAEGSPHEVLTYAGTFTPQVAKIFPGMDWLTVKDAIGERNASQY